MALGSWPNRPASTARMPLFVAWCDAIERYQMRYNSLADPPPPFSLVSSASFGSARSSPGREAAKRTLDGEDRSEGRRK